MFYTLNTLFKGELIDGLYDLQNVRDIPGVLFKYFIILYLLFFHNNNLHTSIGISIYVLYISVVIVKNIFLVISKGL